MLLPALFFALIFPLPEAAQLFPPATDAQKTTPSSATPSATTSSRTDPSPDTPSSTTRAPSDLHQGILTMSFEASVFLPCNSQEKWWFEINPENHEVMDNLREKIAQDLGRSDYNLWRQVMRIDARGTVSKPGAYGLNNRFDRAFTVQEIMDARVASKADLATCGRRP